MSCKASEMLEQFGLTRIENALVDLSKVARTMAERAGRPSNGEPAFEAFPSFIPPVAPTEFFDCCLIIDIGGTSTKTAIRRKDGDSFQWTMLFEIKNNESAPKSAVGNSFVHFSEVIAENIEKALAREGIASSDIHATAVVWSNAIQNKPDALGNITGIVADRVHYNKGEWFIQDLKDGDDIGAMLFKALRERDVLASTYLIANDTPFTMKANPEAQAGMVASTGLNGTLVKNLQDILPNGESRTVICNAEMGGRMAIPANLRSKADFVQDDEEADYIEFLTAGRFLPRLFVSHIIVLADHGLQELEPLALHLKSLGDARWDVYRAKDMNLLTLDRDNFISRREKAELYTPEVLNILELISLGLFKRSAALCALTAYATVSNQLEAKKDCVISLDTRLGREIPGFMDNFQLFLEKLNPEGCSIRLSLMSPLHLGEYEKISVPMQGAAYSLDSLQTYRMSLKQSA